ncbi:MAG TPA: response regulator [Polyangia bacterium]|jgi:CheY-like chemotaxis protein|nr:response regulator [Polyangia bacterium]
MSDESPPNGPAAKAKTILVVDDNADVAEGLREVLEGAGHTAVVATGSVQALALGSEITPDVVISDIELPVMDGYELALHLRARPELSNTVFIALTGYGQAHDPRHSRESGFQHHLVKPVDIDRLLRIVAGGASAY